MDVARNTRTDEAAETQRLETFITCRHEKRVESEGERQAEELYAASVRRYNARREHARRAEWAAYHRQQAERHRATLASLIAHHENQAAKYGENGHYHEEE